ncbi:hypothetical protein AAFF_G00033000 [Aldrovandia affinis]|uniref:LRRCT domain-containing protein n=1 Tax=Aldrovandia affinis TaxID=143900 RepID=A0AAD7S3P4_9TELE|nr:hypothetical protein AAFF_G00033000 [Aldrovandia affinis]
MDPPYALILPDASERCGRGYSYLQPGTERMLSGPVLTILLLLTPSNGQIISSPCQCSTLHNEELHISCGSQNLAEVPHLPPGTTELYLQDNQLTTVPPGRFDTLQGLRRLNLTGNRFHCDCGIWYLFAWLRDHGAVSEQSPTCSTPPSLARRPIAGLSEARFSTCARTTGACGTSHVVMVLAVTALVALLLWCLKTARSFTFTVDVFQRHTGIEAHTPRSLRPKPRRHGASPGNELRLEDTDQCEPVTPLLNMELLPQILDVLQNRHNMKFNAP